MTYEDDMIAFVRARVAENPGTDVQGKREAQAKLAIVDHYEAILDEERKNKDANVKGCAECSGLADGLEYSVAQLTSIYADHPDYDPKWIDFGE